MQTKEPVPERLIHECESCGRPYATSGVRERYDATGLHNGWGGKCMRDRQRLAKRGTLELEQRPSEDTAEEVAHLESMGYTRDRAVRELANQRGVQVDSVQTALRRHARRTERLEAAA